MLCIFHVIRTGLTIVGCGFGQCNRGGRRDRRFSEGRPSLQAIDGSMKAA
jgi:hypothetical protein